jgi:hypothetical protein
VNWGDTFYDLFFVAAAYNVGNILVVSPTLQGFLYFVGCFFPAMQMWRDKMFYDSRFVVGDDIFHRVFETVVYLMAAGGILHIGPVVIMSNPREHPDMFAFALVLTLFSFMNFVGYMEVYFFGVGQPKVLKQVALRDSMWRLIPFGLQLAATIIAGMEYFVYGAGAGNAKELAGYAAEIAADEHDDDHRFLAGDSAYASENEAYVNDLPIILVLAAYVSWCAAMAFFLRFMFPRDGSHKKFTIPMNVAFVIHRDGEWIMLMLGERYGQNVVCLAVVACSYLTISFLLQHSEFADRRYHCKRGVLHHIPLWHFYNCRSPVFALPQPTTRCEPSRNQA